MSFTTISEARDSPKGLLLSKHIKQLWKSASFDVFDINFLDAICFIQEALFFHHRISITSTCLSHFHLSVSGIAPVFLFRVIKRQVLQCSLIL